MIRYTYTVSIAAESGELHNLIRWPIGVQGTPTAFDDMTPRVIGQFATRIGAVMAAEKLKE
jgi:hypothetical protein